MLGGNQSAQRPYGSEGFEVEGIQRGEFLLEGHEVDDVLMARRLTPPPETDGTGG